MRKRLLWLSTVVLAVLASTTVILAADNWLGTWKLNVEKSKYSPGPPPKSLTVKFEASEGGGQVGLGFGVVVKLTSDGVDAQGKPTHGEYSAKFDGKDYPWKGQPNADATSLKRIDDYTYESVWKKGGKVTITTNNVVSPDGKTRTSTQMGKDAQGQDVNNTVVFEKQ